MTKKHSGIVVSKITPADHNFPHVLAGHLALRGWTIAELDSERVTKYPACRDDFSARLAETGASVVFSINYHPNLAKLAIDNQIRYIFWGEVFPLIPSHRTFPDSADVWCFDASPHIAHIWEQNGIPAHYLPLGFDSNVYQPHNVTQDIDVSFIGSGLDHYKPKLLALLDVLETQLRAASNSPARQSIYGSTVEFFWNLLSTTFAQFANHNHDYERFITSYLDTLDCERPLLNAIEGTIRNYRELGQIHFAHRQRVEYLEAIAEVCDLKIFGQGWEQTSLGSRVVGYLPYTEAPAVISRSKISINLQRYYHIGVGDRLFNIPACNSFMLTNDFPSLYDFFSDTQLALFDSKESCQEQISHYLKHESERESIARRGYEHVRDNYTFAHQLAKLLTICEMD